MSGSFLSFSSLPPSGAQDVSSASLTPLQPESPQAPAAILSGLWLSIVNLDAFRPLRDPWSKSFRVGANHLLSLFSA